MTNLPATSNNSEQVIAALGDRPMPQYRELIPQLRAGNLKTVNLPYEAIKNWNAITSCDFNDGAETVTFLIS